MPCRFNETHLGSRWWWKTVLYFFLAIQIASYLGCDIACIAICICLKVFAASSKCTCQYLESKEYATQFLKKKVKKLKRVMKLVLGKSSAQKSSLEDMLCGTKMMMGMEKMKLRQKFQRIRKSLSGRCL
ncbi:hypothetical protein AB3S75_042288 [Citrus x aurantiifolia]